MVKKENDLFIDGCWIRGEGKEFESIDSCDETLVWKGHSASKQQVDLAVHAARKAFPFWSQLPLDKRIDFLHRFKAKLESSKELFAKTICQEVGKPSWDSHSEVASMVAKITISLEAFHIRCPETKVATSTNQDTFVTTHHRPHGVVAVLAPFNFPGHLPNGHIIPALLAGNTVVLKSSEYTPCVGQLMVRLWQESGLPAGVINLVQGGADVGKALSTHPELNGLFFTGSFQVGKELSDYFGKHPDKILALEMGGNNPLVVWNVKDLKAAAYLTLLSAFLTSGQRCTCARRLIIEDAQAGEEFLNTLITATQSLRVGFYTEKPEPFMGPVIHSHAARHLLDAQEQLRQMGGKSLLCLEPLSSKISLLRPGLMDVTSIAQRVDQEFFGPFLQVIRVKTFQEALHEANATAFGLCAGLLSDDASAYEQFSSCVRAGIINWNTPLTGASSRAPFGGVGLSGNHRPSAYYAADYCSYPVACTQLPYLRLPSSPIPGITL